MGARDGLYPHRYPDALGRLRLRLATAHHAARADGLWCPYSRDLTREGAHLVDAWPEDRGRIERMAYAPGDWDVVATQIFTRHGRLKVGYLPGSGGRGVVLLRVGGSEVLRLRVAWPDDPTPEQGAP